MLVGALTRGAAITLEEVARLAGVSRATASRVFTANPRVSDDARRAGRPDEGPADRDVPDPPNELDGPDREPPHSDHGVHEDDSSGSDPAPNAP